MTTLTALIVACTDQTTLVDSGGPRQQVSISSCCPDTDAAIYALFAQYSATSPEARSPELAILPLRFNNGVDAAARRVIGTTLDWQSLWTQLMARSGPSLPTPAVDFERDMLIFVSMGTRGSGGYAISIDSVTKNGRGLTAWLRLRSPGPGCGTTAALTQPIALARLPRSDSPVAFSETSEATRCE